MNYHAIIEFSIFIAIFYAFFIIFFRENKDFKFSRKFIFGSVMLSLVIPILPKINLLGFGDQGSFGIILTPIEIIANNLPFANNLATSPNFNIDTLLLIVYCIISFLLILRFLIGYQKINRVINTGNKSLKKDFILISNSEITTAFSFFNYVVVPSNLIKQEQKLELIIKHELLHRDLGHSTEKIIFNLIKIIFWWHPIIHLMQKDLSIVHEYEVDAAMLDNNSVKSYSLFLVDQIESKNNLLINTISSHIKKRILMMYTSKNTMKTARKYGIALAACLSIFIIHACQNEIIDDTKVAKEKTVNKVSLDKVNGQSTFETTLTDTIITFDFDTKTESEKIVSSTRTVYKSPEQLPRVNGCEDKTNEKEITDCATQKLLQFIYKNITYPKDAKDNNIEGMAVVQFIVSSQGNIYSPKIVRSLGYGTDEIILNMMDLMKKDLGAWIPGNMDGKPVDVQYTLPIKFKLEG